MKPTIFQGRVNEWMAVCFGITIAMDKVERNHRFLEESLELVQSLGCTSSEAHQLVEYVFGRPLGEPKQEVGGVQVTLAALGNANHLDIEECGETELARVWTKVDQIRSKQAGKPKFGPLPSVHDLYKDGDDNVPEQILDRNGQVVLGLCKRCGKAESELTESCVPKHIALLLEAYDFGQFANDFDQPLALPIRAALRKLLDDVYQDTYGIPDMTKTMNYGQSSAADPIRFETTTIGGVEMPLVGIEDLGSVMASMEGPKSMKRDRPYEGQPHTDSGERGRQEVCGITMRDLRDCYVRAVLLSASHLVPHLYSEADKGEDAKLNQNDLYGFDLDELDPIAIGQNLTCEVERMMCIFPNIPKLSDEEEHPLNCGPDGSR